MYRQLTTLIGAAAFAVFPMSAQRALAQTSAASDQRAVNLYNEGLTAQENGNYESACRSFNAAASAWENAIYGLVRENMGTEEARENIKTVADNLQGNVNKAKDHARNVCGKPNRASPSVAPSTGASRGLTPSAQAFYDKTLQEVVYPALDRLGNYMLKTREERLATGSWVEVNRQNCYKARHELTQVGVNGEEAMLCQASALWLQDNAKEACAYLDRDDMKDFFKKSTFAALVKYRDRLYAVVGCGSR